ncbi:ATP-dependent nuclease [Caulobacter segnis]
MLQSIKLDFTDSESLILPMQGVTIFVGPNNSGKSLVLRELEEIFVDQSERNRKIIGSFEFDWGDDEWFEGFISNAVAASPSNVPVGEVQFSRLNPFGGRDAVGIGVQSLKNMRMAHNRNATHVRWWLNMVERWNVLRLDGRSRFQLTDDREGGDLLSPPQNILAHLFVDDSSRDRVRKSIKEAFGVYFVIDPTQLGRLRIRLSSEAPLGDEQSLNVAARVFHGKATHIKDASDGVQAFTGIITSVMSGDYRTVLIDEPEAFLHPPLARKLGRDLATLVGERGGALLASTHSSDFLMGCVTAARSVRVVRLEYRDGKSRGKMVDPSRLEEILKRPLLRSANVVSALFHDGIVVTESDNDRVFYQEIYQRLTAGDDSAPSILFVNAQNKQTAKDIIGPLREFGVPAVAIVDIDVVKDGGQVWTGWMGAAKIPELLHLSLGQQRASLNSALVSTGKNMKTDGGISLLQISERGAADIFFDGMDKFGVFTVRRGELENWLPELGVTGKKTDWAVAMLERLGGDPEAKSYVWPSKDDVWHFMRTVIAWIKDPARLGMP